jgi:ribosomal protein S18 acetylase RimI-like enzyme
MDSAIREAVASDFSQVGAVFAQELQFHVGLLPDRFQMAEPIMTHGWFDEILGNPDKVLFVAEFDAGIVGVLLIMIRTSPADPIFHPRRYAYIDEVAVVERWRGRGVGRALMIRAHEWAQERGAKEVELHVWESNERAIAFYERLGYRAIRRTMKTQLVVGES